MSTANTQDAPGFLVRTAFKPARRQVQFLDIIDVLKRSGENAMAHAVGPACAGLSDFK